MAKFQKASPQQARVKVSMYGPPGSGKTFTALLMAEGLGQVRKRRIAYVDTERGTDFYAQKVPTRRIHPEAFDFDALYTKSLADVTSAIKSLDPAEHGVVVLDSISHLWQAAMDAYEGKMTSAKTIPMQAWGQIKKPYKDLVNWLIASPFDVFILGRQKNVFEEDESDKIRKVGVAMRAESETEYEPHICFRMEARKDEHDPTRSTYMCYVEKDRTGVLAGSTIPNPSFATIEPLLPLLGDVQAPAEDEDERMAKDGELLEAGASKAEAKAEKSRNYLVEYQAKIGGTETIEALGGVGVEIKKISRYLVEEHKNSLRLLYEARRDQIVKLATEVL